MDAVGTLALVAIADGRDGVGPFFQAEDRMSRRRRIIPPGICPAIGAARRLFPLRFRRQSFAYPEAITDRVHPIDPPHRLVRTQHWRFFVGKPPGWLALNRFHEFGEPSVRHFEFIEIKTVEKHFVDRLLIVITLVASHRKFTDWNQHHGGTVPSYYLHGRLRHGGFRWDCSIG